MAFFCLANYCYSAIPPDDPPGEVHYFLPAFAKHHLTTKEREDQKALLENFSMNVGEKHSCDFDNCLSSIAELLRQSANTSQIEDCEISWHVVRPPGIPDEVIREQNRMIDGINSIIVPYQLVLYVYRSQGEMLRVLNRDHWPKVRLHKVCIK
jgi:hypothetical protein